MSKRCCANSCFNAQLTNKSVEYFGFPRHEEYAHKWLELAQRQDLMTKPLNTIIKYFLCSEHFTDDCFVDPQSRSRLKRSVRPFFAPLPSIFKSNIEQYIRTNKPLANTDQHGNEVDADSLAKTADIYQHFIANSIRKEDDEEQDENDFIYVTPIEDDVNVEEAAEGDNDGQNYIIHDGSSQDQVVDEDDKNEELQDEIIVLVEEQETEMELDHAEAKERLMNDATCRLCAKVFAVDDGLMRIFGSDQSIHEDLQLLLNDVISANDGLPQTICFLCYTKLVGCAKVVREFRGAQHRFLV